ncbi:MAG: hypothetical protein AB7E47_04125 [Desulfovibrionaceae bacterium]
MKKVLIVTYGGGHVNLMVPVYRLLPDTLDTSYVGLSIAGPVLERAGIPYTNYSSYADRIMDADALRFGEELAARWHVEGKVPREESVAYLGCGMRDLVRTEGEAVARERLDTLGRKAFVPTWTMERIIDAERPDLIVTTNSPRSERAATLIGNAKGIPTLNIHDGLAFEERHHLTADRLAVMCGITRDNLIRTGHDAARITITGQPAFDPIVREIEEFDRDALCRRHGLDPAGRYILFGSQRQVDEALLVGVIDTVERAMPGHRLLVKPHPGEDPAMFEHVLASRGGFSFFRDVPIRELICASDLMVSLWSTISLEAVLMRRPLIQLNLPGLPNTNPLYDFGVALEAPSLDALGGHMQDVLNGNNGFMESFLAQREAVFSRLLTGRSAEAVANLITSMAAEA